MQNSDAKPNAKTSALSRNQSKQVHKSNSTPDQADIDVLKCVPILQSTDKFKALGKIPKKSKDDKENNPQFG